MTEIEKMITALNIPKIFQAEPIYNKSETTDYEFIKLTNVLHKLMFTQSSS